MYVEGPTVADTAIQLLDGQVAIEAGARVMSALQPRDRKNPRVEITIRRIHKSALLGGQSK